MPSPDGRLLVASDDGLWSVDGEGSAARLSRVSTRRVATHRSWLYALQEDELRWGPIPGARQEFEPTSRRPAADLVDLAAWCDDSVLLATTEGLQQWWPRSGATAPWGPPLPDVVAVSLGPGDPCASALAVTRDAVVRVDPGSAQVLASGLVAPRAAARDAYGRTWVVHGDPPVLARVEGGKAIVFARYLGDPRDLVFGTGGLLHPDNAYLPDAEGSLDYVRIPPP